MLSVPVGEGTRANASARGAVIVGAVVAGLVVLGTVAWFIWGGENNDAVVTPTPSETPSASASATEPQDRSFPAPLPADGFFLDARRLTTKVFGEVSPGWTLTYWQPSRQAYGEAGHDVSDPGLVAMYLVSPQGQRYEVGHFDAQAGERVDQIAWWKPGTLQAIVRVGTDDGTEWKWLDFTDGSLDSVGGMPSDSALVGWSGDGSLIFEDGDAIVAISRDGSRETLIEDGAGAKLSPDGTVLATFAVDDSGGPQPVTAYSASTGDEMWTFDSQSLANGDELCTAGGWAAPNEPAVVCQSWGGTDENYAVGPASFYALSAQGATNFYTTDDGQAWGSPQIAADGVVATGSDPNAQGIGRLYYLKEDADGPLVAPTGHGDYPQLQTLGSVDITRWSSMADYTSTTARDVSTGAAFDVTPPLQADTEWWWTTHQAVFLVGGVGGAS